MIFNKKKGYFWHSYIKPNNDNWHKIRKAVPLDMVVAIQLLPEKCRDEVSNTTNYHSRPKRHNDIV